MAEWLHRAEPGLTSSNVRLNNLLILIVQFYNITSTTWPRVFFSISTFIATTAPHSSAPLNVITVIFRPILLDMVEFVDVAELEVAAELVVEAPLGLDVLALLVVSALLPVGVVEALPPLKIVVPGI